MLGPFRPGAVAAARADRARARPRAARRARRPRQRSTCATTTRRRSPRRSRRSSSAFPVEDATRLVDAGSTAFVRRDPDRRRASATRATAARARDCYDYLMVDLVAERRRRAAPTDRPTSLDDLLASTPATEPARRRRDRGPARHAVHRRHPRRCPKIVAGGAYELWRRPDQRAALVADPRPYRAGLRGDAPTRAPAAVRRPHPARRRRGRGRRDARRAARRAPADLREPRRARVRRSGALRRPTAVMERHLGFGHGVARVHRRARRPARRRRAGAGAARAGTRTTRSIDADLAREARSSTWAGPGCRSRPVLGSAGSGGPRRRPPRRLRPGCARYFVVPGNGRVANRLARGAVPHHEGSGGEVPDPAMSRAEDRRPQRDR